MKKQLKDKLNIEVELKISPFAQIAEKSIMGRYDFLRLAWIADYIIKIITFSEIHQKSGG